MLRWILTWKAESLSWIGYDKDMVVSATSLMESSFELYGLEVLSIIRDAVEVIQANKGVSLDVERIPIQLTSKYSLNEKTRSNRYGILFQRSEKFCTKHTE